MSKGLEFEKSSQEVGEMLQERAREWVGAYSRETFQEVSGEFPRSQPQDEGQNTELCPQSKTHLPEVNDMELTMSLADQTFGHLVSDSGEIDWDAFMGQFTTSSTENQGASETAQQATEAQTIDVDVRASALEVGPSQQDRRPIAAAATAETDQHDASMTKSAIPALYDDSGYGSLPAKSMATGKLDGTMLRQEEPMERARPNSGTDEAVGTATVFSDANSILGHPSLDQYVIAFAGQLAACQPPGFDAMVTGGSLDRHLKAFAVRLSHESTERPQRHLAYIASRFRRSVKQKELERPRTEMGIANSLCVTQRHHKPSSALYACE